MKLKDSNELMNFIQACIGNVNAFGRIYFLNNILKISDICASNAFS